MIKIHPTEVYELRAQGWTLERLAQRYGCTKVAVHNYLKRSRTRVNAPRKPKPCLHCGEPTLKKFCSPECYHASYQTRTFVHWRHGQRIARQLVAEVFPLQVEHVVHHEDGNERNNSLSNLWVFASQAAHLSYHRGGKAQPIWCGDRDLQQAQHVA